MSEKVKFLVTGDVKAPVRKMTSDGADAGIDIFVPNLSDAFIEEITKENPGHPYKWGLIGAPVADEKEKNPNAGVFIYIGPGQSLLIPTYLKTRIPSDMYLKIADKSGVSTKQKVEVSIADTIDASYEGISHVLITNFSNEIRFIEFGQKIAQLIHIKIDNQGIEIFYDEAFEGFKDIAENTKMSSEKFFEGHTKDRKEGGFGSTGIK